MFYINDNITGWIHITIDSVRSEWFHNINLIYIISPFNFQVCDFIKWYDFEILTYENDLWEVRQFCSTDYAKMFNKLGVGNKDIVFCMT